MGICCTSKKLFYTDVDSHEELEIRRWEETQLKAYEYTFSYLRSKLRLNSNIENKEKVVKMLREEINEEASNFVSKTKLFDEGDKFISLNKIRAFVFLLTRPEKFKSESGKSYYDKASYLIQEILCNEEDSLNGAVEVLNTNLKRVLDFIIEVALEGITKFYVSQKNESPYLSEILKLDKNQISDYIVQHMFTKIDGDKTHKIDQFDFNDLNKKFDYDTWFLTPGYIRELAYDLHIFNNNQPEKTEGHN